MVLEGPEKNLSCNLFKIQSLEIQGIIKYFA